MTYDEAKDQVAKRWGFKDWPDMLANEHYTNVESRHSKAAELYARSKWDEA